ncbi:MAG: radical SAM family heme chaperone HemW, partial [Terriglobales bacterium]
AQYEISNFARPGFASRHNERYWLRRPYLGFGLEAHSFLRQPEARRWGNTADMREYLTAVEAGRPPVAEQTALTPAQALEEALFLGLRRNAGVEWAALREEFGGEPVESKQVVAAELAAAGCLEERNGQVALTARGRLLANEVFERFLA